MSTGSDEANVRPSFREHPLEFALGLFADVRPGEAISAIALTATIFLLLTAYYMLKVAREPLILVGGGAEVKSYASAGQAILLVGFSFAYGALSKRVSRIRLVVSVSLFFASNLMLLFVLAGTSLPIGVPFYLWVGVFNMSVIAQFWGFAADILGDARGKRLFPVLGIGSSSGAVAGAGVARSLVGLGFGPQGLMAGACAILLACTGLIAWVHAREHHHEDDRAAEDEPLPGPNGFAMLLQDRYLLLLGVFAIILNAVNSTGEYVLDGVLLATAKMEADPKAYIGAFKATYFAWVNIIGMALQMFAVSRILKYIGLTRALFVMPFVSFMGYGVIAIFPILSVVFAAKMGENSLDYSLSNTSRQSLWLPTSKAAKYKAKQVVDTFLVRLGDVASACLVWTCVRIGLTTRHVAAINALLVVGWVIALIRLAALYKKRTGESA
jgi:ATP:ADP antiporter, AAA family